MDTEIRVGETVSTQNSQETEGLQSDAHKSQIRFGFEKLEKEIEGECKKKERKRQTRVPSDSQDR